MDPLLYIYLNINYIVPKSPLSLIPLSVGIWSCAHTPCLDDKGNAFYTERLQHILNQSTSSWVPVITNRVKAAMILQALNSNHNYTLPQLLVALAFLFMWLVPLFRHGILQIVRQFYARWNWDMVSYYSRTCFRLVFHFWDV